MTETAVTYKYIRFGTATIPPGSSSHELLLRLAALLIMVYGWIAMEMRPVLYVVCGSMLALPSVIWSRSLWVTLSAVMVTITAATWNINDNHHYLITYICLLCCASLFVEDGIGYFRCAARLTIGAVFTLAVGWKLAATQYLDGSFLYFTLLTDSRVQDIGAAISGIPLDQIKSDTLQLRRLATGADSVQLLDSPQLRLVSLWLSWGTLLIEGFIAAAFVTPSDKLTVLRHVLLLTFVGATYWILPVTGFGSALIVLGLSQCVDADRSWRFAYLGLLAILQFTAIPWRSYL